MAGNSQLAARPSTGSGPAIRSSQLPTRNSRGFTLLELLLALTLVAMILVEAMAIFWGTLRTYDRTRESAEREDQARSALRLIGEDLDRVAVQVGPVAALVAGDALSGAPGEDPLLRLRTRSRLLPGAEPLLVDYFLVPAAEVGRAGDGFLLVRRSQPIGRDPAGVAWAAEPREAYFEVVLPDVRDWSIRFYDGAGWQTSWDAAEQGRLPRLVEVSFRLGDAAADRPRYGRQFELVAAAAFTDGPAEARP